MMKKLCVFPNDPIKAYYEKGEIKNRYYNPNNFFDEIHIISFVEKDIDESKVRILAGDAKLIIHSVGKINLKNKTKHKEKIVDLVKSINPSIIRSYNPLVQGWFAALCSSELKIPFYLSLHINHDGMREMYKKNNFKKFLAVKYTEKFIEPYVLKNATKITIVYKIIEPYVIKHTKKNPELLYNKIDFNRFKDAKPMKSFEKPMIISVGRLTEQKNHQCLIKAMKEINANLLIIGNGEKYDELNSLIKKIKVENKVKIKKSVSNLEIQNYYKSADVFALAYDPKLEGLPIPVIEGMASGLPIVIPNLVEGLSDGLEKVVMFANRDPSSFAFNINKILNDSNLHQELSNKSFSKAKDFDEAIIEKREAQIYSELLS